MKNKLLKKIIIGTGSISVGAGIVLSAPGIINSSQNKTRTNKDYISDYFDFNQIARMEDSTLEEILQDKDGNIWVGTLDGLWKSTDGSTFTQITNGIGNNWNIYSLMQDKDGNIWVGTRHGLWKSSDGSTFTQITNEIALNNRIIESLMQDKDGNIWVGTYGKGLYKSTDGSTFTQITNGIGNNWIIYSLMQDKDGNIWVGTNGQGLWKSTDGSTFTQITNGIENDWIIYSLMQDKDGNIWVGTYGQGLYKSTDGSTFTQITNGIGNWWIYSLMQDKDGNIWVGTNGQGLWKSTDGSTFTQITNGIENDWTIYSLMQDKEGNIWVGTYGGLWKKTSEVIFTQGATHNTIEEEGQTIYISDQSITLNIPPADQIIIDGEIISKTKEVTKYTFDSTESPHAITITIAGQHYVILVYVVESAEEINYVSYNNVPDSEGNLNLEIFLDQNYANNIIRLLKVKDLNLLSLISSFGPWNDLISKNTDFSNILGEIFGDQLANIDGALTGANQPEPFQYKVKMTEKIDELSSNSEEERGIVIKLSLDKNKLITNLGDFADNYWDKILFTWSTWNEGSV